MEEKVIVSFVFNSPMLYPWVLVEGLQGSDQRGDLQEAMMLWNEAHRDGYRFRDNELVVDTDNPYQKMRVRRMIYKIVGDSSRRLVGIECYWWHSIGEVLPATLMGKRRVPGATPMTEKEIPEIMK